jgi:hypothetical protein
LHLTNTNETITKTMTTCVSRHKHILLLQIRLTHNQLRDPSDSEWRWPNIHNWWFLMTTLRKKKTYYKDQEKGTIQHLTNTIKHIMITR